MAKGHSAQLRSFCFAVSAWILSAVYTCYCSRLWQN